MISSDPLGIYVHVYTPKIYRNIYIYIGFRFAPPWNLGLKAAQRHGQTQVSGACRDYRVVRSRKPEPTTARE